MCTSTHLMIVLAIASFACQQSMARDKGWALLVNQTARPITVTIKSSQGKLGSPTIKPNESLPLRRETRYSIVIHETKDSYSLDARPLSLDDGEITNPKWREEEKSDESYEIPRTVWETRWYQIVDVSGRAELMQGFSKRDVEAAVDRYRSEMENRGFDLKSPLVYEPFLLGFEDELQEDAQIKRELGLAIRRLQHRVLAEILQDTVVAGKKDFGNSDEAGEDISALDDFSIHIGNTELDSVLNSVISPRFDFDPQVLEEQDSNNSRLALKGKAVIVLPWRTSPEVFKLARSTFKRTGRVNCSS